MPKQEDYTTLGGSITKKSFYYRKEQIFPYAIHLMGRVAECRRE